MKTNYYIVHTQTTAKRVATEKNCKIKKDEKFKLISLLQKALLPFEINTYITSYKLLLYRTWFPECIPIGRDDLRHELLAGRGQRANRSAARWRLF